ncbi:MAG: MFS transporter [Bacteroidales bacterium]|jgi:MFS family permease|nr:MFS transporter [Bacteroidales bacterium]MDY0084644.1 MFS transporter [Bacteroidales bacterium]
MLTTEISRHNFRSLIWHAGFLSFAQVFIDVDTVIPAMFIEAGGSALQLGILTAIMLGGSSFTQLFFAPFISNYNYKKKFLLIGINARMLALILMAVLLFSVADSPPRYTIWLVYVLIGLFSFGGAFANISFTDILGKSVLQQSRKPFFSVKLVLNGLVFLLAAALASRLVDAFGYPLNYAWMFVVGFVALSIASLGFWNLKEVVPSRLSIPSFKVFIQLFANELKENRNLPAFLGFINTQGITIAFLPFVMLYAKESMGTGSADTGNFLIYKIIGSVGAGFGLFLLSGKFRYSRLIVGNALVASVLPFLLLILGENSPVWFLFLLGGITFAVYQVSMNGVLLEVSGNANRALYTGITGAGNILPALFPLLGGWLINSFGFNLFFGLYLVTVLLSVFFAMRIKCSN